MLQTVDCQNLVEMSTTYKVEVTSLSSMRFELEKREESA